MTFFLRASLGQYISCWSILAQESKQEFPSDCVNLTASLLSFVSTLPSQSGKVYLFHSSIVKISYFITVFYNKKLLYTV